MVETRDDFVVVIRNSKDEADQDVAQTGLFSGSMTQLTVFLTGLVLAVTAYAVLNVLIQDVVRDDFQRSIDDTRTSIVGKLTGFEEAIRMAGAIVTLSGGGADEDIIRSIHESVPNTALFDRVFLARMPSAGEEGWRIVTIRAQDDGGVSQSGLKGLAHAVMIKAAGEQEDDVLVLTDVPGTRYWQENADPVVKGRPFIVAKKIVIGGQDVGVLVGLGRISGVIGQSWIEHRGAIKRISIRDLGSGRSLYYMNRDLSAPDSDDIDFTDSGSNSEFKIGDSTWQLNLLAGRDKGSGLLENTPWLMLAFGLILTLVGTLYVRNNKLQSFRLALMNRELAQKNYELNKEVTERERLNHVLRKAEQDYKAIVDTVSDIIFEASADGALVFLNDTWKRVTGFDPEQVMGHSLFSLLHPQDQEEQRASFDLLLKGKKKSSRTFTRLRTSDGTFRSVELSLSMMDHDQDRNGRIVGTFTDVEERRRAEKALGEAEKKYRTIVENAAGGIYQVTPEGQFLSANPAMARILGYKSPEQMVREIKNAHDNLYVNARERTAFLRELETAGFVHNFETCIKTRDGAERWVNENTRAVRDDDGNVLYYEGSLEDITSRKQAELSLREAKLQSDLASRAKSEFLANMSHELRTPLNAIIGFSEIIKNEVLGPMGNRQYWEYAKDIYDSGRNLLTIINEILDVSRIDAGDRQINEGVVKMDKVIKSCLDFTSQKAKEGGVTFTNLTDGKIPDIIGEELAIKQILLNLLNNAVKYTPEAGRITVSHDLDSDGRLLVSVTDTGIGMDEHEIAKALLPFGQVEAGHNRSGSGAGLGLTLVEALMTLHDGNVEILSQKGIGTTVTLVFPARRVARNAGSENAGKDVSVRAADEDRDGDNGSHRFH